MAQDSWDPDPQIKRNYGPYKAHMLAGARQSLIDSITHTHSETLLRCLPKLGIPTGEYCKGIPPPKALPLGASMQGKTVNVQGYELNNWTTPDTLADVGYILDTNEVKLEPSAAQGRPSEIAEASTSNSKDQGSGSQVSMISKDSMSSPPPPPHLMSLNLSPNNLTGLPLMQDQSLMNMYGPKFSNSIDLTQDEVIDLTGTSVKEEPKKITGVSRTGRIWYEAPKSEWRPFHQNFPFPNQNPNQSKKKRKKKSRFSDGSNQNGSPRRYAGSMNHSGYSHGNEGGQGGSANYSSMHHQY